MVAETVRQKSLRRGQTGVGRHTPRGVRGKSAGEPHQPQNLGRAWRFLNFLQQAEAAWQASFSMADIGRPGLQQGHRGGLLGQPGWGGKFSSAGMRTSEPRKGEEVSEGLFVHGEEQSKDRNKGKTPNKSKEQDKGVIKV